MSFIDILLGLCIAMHRVCVLWRKYYDIFYLYWCGRKRLSLIEAMLLQWWTYFNYSCIFYAITSLPGIYLILSYLILAYSPESSESPESLLCQNHQKHYNQQNYQNQSGFKVTLLHLWDFSLLCIFKCVHKWSSKKTFTFT